MLGGMIADAEPVVNAHAGREMREESASIRTEQRQELHKLLGRCLKAAN